MNVAQIRLYDVANGEGVRATLFVSGCTHRCLGCFNKDYQSFDYGKKWLPQAEETLLNHLDTSCVKGLSILGGEPFQQDEQLLQLVMRVKIKTSKSIWVWSGYYFEDLLKNPLQRAILDYIDVLVDGPFLLEQRDLKLKFRGSRNQRLIDVQKSLELGEIVHYETE